MFCVGNDEPHIVSWRVLEGVTEPFESQQHREVPAWKLMKDAADQKAASLAIQQALHEYGQLLRHPYMFGEMPMEDRYDVFLSMSKLLKIMGFHQRAELLLYEAMSYTTNPYEAHYQLGLLFLDKEDLEKAKMNFKNCLFFKETDILILVHLSVILIAEGKMHEAKFFLSRILTALEARVNKLSFMVSEQAIKSLTDKIDFKLLSNWVEDLIVKVFYGEFRITPSSTIDMLKYFSNLYSWISAGDMTGRFIFDLGQSLYEGGRPKIGRMMMKRGYETSDAEIEGEVSIEVVKMRLALDYPVTPDSVLDIVEAYLTMTSFLSDSADSYITIDYENSLDIYWPVPLMGWSGLPTGPVLKELAWRFDGGPIRNDRFSQLWLSNVSYDTVLDAFLTVSVVDSSQESIRGTNVDDSDEDVYIDEEEVTKAVHPRKTTDEGVANLDSLSQLNNNVKNGIKTIVIPPNSLVHTKVKVEVGILGGHMNNHPVGHMVFRRILNQALDIDKRTGVSFTLIATALIPDSFTKKIAGAVQRIVNLPMDTSQAWTILEGLQLDIVLFPDWQPFPDQQALLFQSRRIAPIQMCFFVRGTPCVSETIDYYLLPEELQDNYLNAVAAADIHAKSKIWTNDEFGNPKVLNKSLRPAWKEVYLDSQVVLLDWPLMSSEIVQDVTLSVTSDSNSQSNRRAQHSGDSEASFNHNVLEENVSGSMFTPLETEGKIFFEGQPVAVLPLYPTFMHPMMDEVIFKIMRSVSSLHLVIALPDTFFTHAHDAKHKISWARKLVRRLWSK